MTLPPRLVKAYTDLTVNSNAGSSTTLDLDAGTRQILIVATTACRFAFAASLAAGAGTLIPANFPMIFTVPAGMAAAALAIAAISDTTTAGRLGVTSISS